MTEVTPGAGMVCSAFHFIKAVVNQVGALRTGLQACARSGSGNETMVNCVVSVSSRDNNEWYH